MNLESGLNTYTYKKEHNIIIEDAKKEFLDDLAKGENIIIAHGIYSPENKNSDAYVKVIRTPEGNNILKVYGCKFKYKGHSPREMVYGMQFAKYLVFQIPREIIAKNWLFALAMVFSFLFQRKKLLRDIRWMLHEMNNRIRWYYDIPEIQQKIKQGSTNYFAVEKKRLGDHYVEINFSEVFYNPFEREIARSARKAAERESKLWQELIDALVRFVCLFLYVDNTYRLRLQDGLAEGEDIYGTLDILAQRENTPAQSPKWRLIKLAIRILTILSPAVKRITSNFFKNLDLSKVKMDEDDWYWALGFRSYNCGGKSLEWRQAERKRLDELHHTVFLR